MNCLLLYKSKWPHVATHWVTVVLSSHFLLSCCAPKHVLCLPGWLISSGVMSWALWKQDYSSCISETHRSCYSGWCWIYCTVQLLGPLNLLAHLIASIIYFLIYLVGIRALLSLAANAQSVTFIHIKAEMEIWKCKIRLLISPSLNRLLNARDI